MSVAYFRNHARRSRFPWSLYHESIDDLVASAINEIAAPRVLVVGCGLAPECPGARGDSTMFGCDLDAAAIDACRRERPEMSDRLAVCDDAMSLPRTGRFEEDFDVVVAKEVVEHLDAPSAWATMLTARLKPRGRLVLTTPNYGRGSTLPLLERTVLEALARIDGYSRRDIHPSKFTEDSLRRLDVGSGARLIDVKRSLFGWALVGTWRCTR